MIHVEDKRFVLPDGRTLAYADNGNTSSSAIILYFHGAFGVGDASRPSSILLEKNVHFIAPSLPGWGRSSPVPSPSTYATTLATDIAALIIHLHPQRFNIRLYICGYSFGSMAAQVLYGASAETFPFIRQISGLVLLAPISPPHCHEDYTKCMTWQNYFMTGPPARYMPFNLVSRLASVYIARKIQTESSADAFLKKTTFDIMDEEESATFMRWREDCGLEEGQFEREMRRNMLRSVAHTWRGFLDIPAIYHTGWGGLHPDKLNEGHPKSPVIVVTSSNDNLGSRTMAQYLASKYPSAKLKVLHGGHISAFFHMDDIWKEML